MLRALTFDPRERFNVLSHLTAAALSGLGTVTTVAVLSVNGCGLRATAFGLCGATLTLCFVASVAYHGARQALRPIYRRFDRASIYLAIAGWYTPVALLGLDGSARLFVLGAAWAVALAGAALELTSRCGDRRSVALYFALGWLFLIELGELVEWLSPAGLGWVLAGGALISVGGIVVCLPRIPHNHETWHVLAMAGCACEAAALGLCAS